MQSLMFSMAVLTVRLSCVLMSLVLCRGFDWHRVLHRSYYYLAQWIYVFVSIALGHLVGTFFVEVMQIIQISVQIIVQN